MKTKALLTSLVFVLVISLCSAENTGYLRKYGGYYTAERIANLRNNCAKYKWAKKKQDAAILRAKVWLAKSDEELWSMIPGQDLPRTIDVTFDRKTPGSMETGCLVCGGKITKY
jgi:hypothetical protein